jgi:putative tryptophan/tyrosine transport system substrate-binding protein
MNRRALLLGFTLLLADARTARARAKAGRRRIGYLTLGTSNSTTARLYRPAFEAALRRAGHETGKTIDIEYRWAAGDLGRLYTFAEELVRLRVEVIVAGTNDAIAAARRATSSIPIVMMTGSTAVELGFIESLARPGGNVTGTLWNAPEMGGKYIEVIRDAFRRGKRVAVLWNPGYPGMRLYAPHIERVAGHAGITIQYFEVERPDEIPPALLRIGAGKPDVLYFVGEPITYSRIAETAAFALAQRMPSLGTSPQWVEAGGLLYYGPDLAYLVERTATYVDRVLRGFKPAELPAELPTRFETTINAKTARAIGYVTPPSLLARAPAVIE